MPNVEFTRKARLSRQEVADRLIALGRALESGSEVELSSGGDTLKIDVADHVNWELEIEIEGDETELEIEIKWTDDPSGDAEPDADDQAAGAAAPKSGPARRGRSRRTAAS